MKIGGELRLRKIADEYIMIIDNGGHVDYTKAVALNETAVFLIEASRDIDIDARKWADLLLERYEVEEERALADATALIDKLCQLGVLH